MQELTPAGKASKPKPIRALSTMAFVVIPIVIFLGLFVAAAILDVSLNDGIICLIVGLGIVLTAGLIVAVNLIFRRLLKAKVDDMVVRANSPVQPGEPLTVDITQTINGQVEVESIEAELLLQEWVRYQQGTDTVTKTHDHIAEAQTMPGGTYNSGSMIQQRFRFDLPSDSMHTLIADMQPTLEAAARGTSMSDPSYDAETTEDKWVRQMANASDESEAEMRQKMQQMPPGARKLFDTMLTSGMLSRLSTKNNTLRWYIRIRVRMRNWVDYVQTFEITVLPAVADEEANEYGFDRF